MIEYIELIFVWLYSMLESQTDRTSAAQYRQAATTGSQVQNEQFCQQFFPTCAFQSNEIIRIGNQMING